MQTDNDVRNIQRTIGEAVILLSDERQILSKNAVMAKLQQLGETEADDRRVLLYWNARKRLGYIRASVTGFTLPSHNPHWSSSGSNQADNDDGTQHWQSHSAVRQRRDDDGKNRNG